MYIFRILILLFLWITPAKAETTPPQLSTFLTLMEIHCGDTEKMVKTIINVYKEVQVFAGISTNRQEVISIYKEPEGESWTFLVSKPNNISCLFMTGLQGVTKNIIKPKKNIRKLPISFLMSKRRK